MEHITIVSCHSRWVFDTEHMRFRRVLKGLGLGMRTVMTEWRQYTDLHIDEYSDSFTVVLNESGTPMLRSWCHRHGVCAECGANSTQELSLDDIAHVRSH